MLGQKDFSPKLFYNIQLEDLVPVDHELRKIIQLIDFSEVRSKVKDKYSHTGQPSVDPEVIIKMLFLGYYYGINSERQLVKRAVTDLGYRWFLGYDLDEAIPTHSVLSKARSRYGIEVFQSLFDGVVQQCVQAGLVGGKRAFIDATLIEANASENSLVPRVQVMTAREYTTHMMGTSELPTAPLDPPSGSGSDQPKSTRPFNDQMVSTTDPDATYIARGKKAGLNYEGHYLVDGENKVIVGVTTTDTIGNAGSYAPELLSRAYFRHGIRFSSLCGDAEYGTQSLYQFLFGQGITPYIPAVDPGTRTDGIFEKSAFQYENQQDAYRCPAGAELKRKSTNYQRQQITYQAQPTVCNFCSLKSLCTTGKHGRKLKRMIYEEAVQKAKALRMTLEYQKHIRARRIVVEPLFSEAKECHGMRRASYRGTQRVGIQVLWTATVQNIKRLMKTVTRPPRLAIAALKGRITRNLYETQIYLISLSNCQRPTRVTP